LGLDDPITFDKFSVAVEKTTEAVSKDPYEVARYAIERLMEKKQSFITVKQFKEIIEAHRMLTDEDIINIMNEVRYLPMRNAEISIDMIARLIRDSIEGLAR